MAASDKKPKSDRVELPPPPQVWISLAILAAYVFVAVEGAIVFYNYPWLRALSVEQYFVGDEIFSSVASGQLHLCLIYIVESLIAAGPGWCAMSPGWTPFELFVHHVPYVAAVSLAFYGNHAARWTAPMVMVLLTPMNEGLFIAQSLGAPEYLAKVRRLFGFCAVFALWIVESLTLLRNYALHYSVGMSSWPSLLTDSVALGGIYYHFMLLGLYIRRWKKTRSL